MSHATDTQHRGGPTRGLLRPPLVFLAAILVGIAVNRLRPLGFVPSPLRPAGAVLAACAVALFALSFREFRAAGTSVRGSSRTTTIVRTGPYRFSRNPIYVSFVVLLIGLAIWLDNLWLCVTLLPAAAFIVRVVVPREERYLERYFRDEYSSYRAAVRRFL